MIWLCFQCRGTCCNTHVAIVCCTLADLVSASDKAVFTSVCCPLSVRVPCLTVIPIHPLNMHGESREFLIMVGKKTSDRQLGVFAQGEGCFLVADSEVSQDAVSCLHLEFPC